MQLSNIESRLCCLVSGYTDRRRTDDNETTMYDTYDVNGKVFRLIGIHWRSGVLSEGQQQQYPDQYPSQRSNYNKRYGHSRGYRGDGSYRYNNNNNNSNFSNEYYEENYGIGSQSQHKFSNNGMDSNNGTTSENVNGGSKGPRTSKQQSNGVKPIWIDRMQST